MKTPKAKAIELLEQQLEPIPALKEGRHNSPVFEKWRHMTRSIIANLFGQESQQNTSFAKICYHPMLPVARMPDGGSQHFYHKGLELAEAQLEALLQEVDTFWHEEQAHPDSNPVSILNTLFNRFHIVAKQLQNRHANRPTLNVSDEYDAQDLLHALLRLFFDDVRAEEWTPSFAGACSRMDFILNEHGIVIELKKTREGMTAKIVGEELLVDIVRYKTYPGTKFLFCFIYDPDGFLRNPAGLERDLSRVTDGIEVKCLVRPK